MSFTIEAYPMTEQIRALLAVIVVATGMFLFAVQAPIPDSLLTIIGIVLTFYFMASQQDKALQVAKEQTDVAVKAALATPGEKT